MTRGQAVFLKQRRPLTFTICIKVQHAAGPHHSLQGNDLVQRHPKQFIVVEPTGWRMVGFVGTEIMVAKGKPLLSRTMREETGEVW